MDVSDTAITFLVNEHYEAGAEYWEAAIAQQPNLATNYWYLGLIRLLQGDEAEAQAVWFTGLAAIDPEGMDATMQTLLTILKTEAERQLEIGNAHLAEQIYHQVLELDPHQPTIYLQLGNAVSLQGNLDAAIAYWQAATQLQPDLTGAYVQQAKTFYRLQQWEDAIAAYRQAIELEPAYESFYNLALCLGQQRQWSAALEQLNQAVVLQPDFAPAYGERGWAHLELKQWSDATREFQTALQYYSNYAQTYNNWVAQLQQAGLPVPDVLQNNARQLTLLCTDSEQAWQQWAVASLQTTAIAPHFLETAGIVSTQYWLETESWATTQEADVTYTKLDASSSLTLKPPKTRDQAIHFSFRFEHEILLPETFVVSIPNGRFWLSSDQSVNAIFTASNELLGDLSPEYPLLSPGHPEKHPSRHSVLGQTLPSAEVINGRVAVIAGLTNEMYFHWMFDILPRFDLLVRSGIDFQSIDYFLVSSQQSFQRETLQQLGLPSEKILEASQHRHLQATQLIVPSYPSSPAWMTKRVCHWLQQQFIKSRNQECHRGDRLYITRQHGTNRRIINEPEVTEFLHQLGFETVVLEMLSVQEQASLLASAAIVISAHGGGLTNLTFCQPGTKVIEIFSPNFVYPCYWLVSNLLGLDYYYFTGQIPAGFSLHSRLYPNPRLEDILVELDEFKELVYQVIDPPETSELR